MPVEVEKRVEELAKNGNGLAILGEDDEPSEISVQIAGVVHEEEDVQPQGDENRAHGYVGADEAGYDDGQYQVSTGNEAIELESQELDQEGQPGSPNVIQTHEPQGSNDDESPTIAIHDVQDVEPNIDDYEAETDAAEDTEENVDDDNHPSEQDIDSNLNGQMDSQYGSRSGRYNLRP